MPTQFITDSKGKKVSVIVPVKDYERMLEELDELNCIKAYDNAKSNKQEFIPLKQAFNQIERKRKTRKSA